MTNQLLCSVLLQLDQLVVDAAKEKRDMEQKHSTIQQKVHSDSHNMAPSSLQFKQKCTKYRQSKIAFTLLALGTYSKS